MTRIRRSMRERRLLGVQPITRLRLVALASALAVTWLSLAGPIGGATASSPRLVTAWWTTANVGHGVAVPGSLLGASGKQLLVEGSNALPPVAAVSTAPVSSIAVAALGWQLAPGEQAASLTLAFGASPPPFVTIQACRVTASFASVYGGPYADVPSYSCADAIDGVVKGGRLTFAGIGKLANGSTLSVLLLPGPLDRVVLAPPSLNSLVVTASRVPHPSHPCPCGPPKHVGGGSAGAKGGGAGTAGGAGPLPSIPPVPQTSPAPPTAPAPVVAGSGGSATQPVALSQSLPTWRRWLAASIIALEVLVFMVTRRSATREATPGRGIGRFVAERESPPIGI